MSQVGICGSVSVLKYQGYEAYLPKLRYCADETASEHPWCTLSNVQVGRDVNTAEAQASEQSANDQHCIGVGYALDDNANTHE